MADSKHEKALILSDGGLAGLVASAMIAEEGLSSGISGPAGAVWAYPAHLEYSKVLGQASERAAARQAEAMGLEFLGLAALGSAGASARFGIDGQTESVLLVTAAYTAAQAGIRRVIWPIQARTESGLVDLEAAARAVDRALLAGRLATLDLEGVEGRHTVPEVRIETPLVDLSDTELADLAMDMAAPVRSCWWWGGQAADLPVAEAEWDRWAERLGAGGETAGRPLAGREA